MGDLLKYLGSSGVESLYKQQQSTQSGGYQNTNSGYSGLNGLNRPPSYNQSDYGQQQNTSSGYSAYNNHQHRKVDASRPYIVLVQNGAGYLQNYVIFGSSENRTHPNFGNPPQITITYGLAGYSYTQLLADTEAKPFTLGRIRIDLLDTNTANLTSPLSVIKTSSEGTVFQSPLTPYTALNQFITSAIEIPCNFEVDADTSIRGSLLAQSGIRLSFFPAHRYGMNQMDRIERERLRKLAQEAAEYEEMKMLLLITIRGRA